MTSRASSVASGIQAHIGPEVVSGTQSDGGIELDGGAQFDGRTQVFAFEGVLSSVRPLVAAASLALGTVLWQASIAFAASPTPSPAAGGDPRSSGQGPGLVGDPAFALLAVAVIGITSVVLTLAWVRLTASRST